MRLYSAEAPGLDSRFGGRSNQKSVDIEFEERLEAVKRYVITKA